MMKLESLISAALLLTADVSTNDDVDEVNQVCKGDSCPRCKHFDIADFSGRSDFKSIFFGEARGRLGNQLLGYALLQHFRHVVGVDAFINRECQDYMLKIFTPDSIQVPVMEDNWCNPQDIPWEFYHGPIKDILTDERYRKGRFILLYPPIDDETSSGYRPEDHLSIEQEAMQQSYIKFLQKTLHFKPGIMTRMKITMKQVAKKLGSKPKELTYVGIHNRRTDGIDFIKRGWFQEELGVEFFNDAMDYFREEYDNVAFLYVSDDMEWGRDNLSADDLFFVGDGTETDEGIGVDLALMVYSNHTIITRGTFSMWAAMLCGGEYYTEYGTIIPPDMMEY